MNERRSERRKKSKVYEAEQIPVIERKEPKKLRPLNESQFDLIKSIQSNIVTFATGVSGTGKTYVTTSYAAQLLQQGDIKTLIFSRPGVECGRNYGALPGELSEKFEPFMEPVIAILHERLGKTFTDYLVKRGQIQYKPLEFMRGMSFKDSFIVLDEAQNATPVQMKLLLTRIGENCRVVVDGDIEQKDIHGMSGLLDAVTRLKNVENVGCVNFDVEDCVRSDIVIYILKAYARA
jgi:phosphate starvation-inducible PhoH-like protein